MKTEHLVEGLPCTVRYGNLHTEIDHISCNSKEIGPGGCFVCLPGYHSSGEAYIDEAIKRGAVTVLTDVDKVCAGILAGRFYQYPWREVILTGITGTKGKTTVTAYMEQIFRETGYLCGTIGTLGVKIPGKESYLSLNNTTPDVFTLNKYLQLEQRAGCTHVVMEVSSQSLKDGRVSGISFDYGIFTNIGNDHIGENEHKDFQDYLQAKTKLFSMCRYGILNRDDSCYPYIRKRSDCKVFTYGFDGKKDVSFVEYNRAAAKMACHLQGVPEIKADAVLKDACAKGRMEELPVSKPYRIMIDYAHNENSMENILEYVAKQCQGRIITVFGCGGNRCRMRRITMGRVAGRLADMNILTEDNSREEDVMDIIAQIAEGIREVHGKYMIVPDRREAIYHAMDLAQKGDMILLLGKGHETYLEKHGKRYPFDERQIVRERIQQEKK